MEKNKNTKLPKFFNYDQDIVDNGYETIQDFYLSWLIRCSNKKYEEAEPKIYDYSKNAVLALIYGKNDETNDKFLLNDKPERTAKIIEAKTYRQWNRIDLVAEITFEDNQHYVLNIENKWYSSIRNGQLESAKKHTAQIYKGDKWTIINLVIFCDHTKLDSRTKQHCKNNDYKFLTMKLFKNNSLKMS